MFVRVILTIGIIVLAPALAHAQQVSVPTVFHRQEHTLSCEVASLKTALKVLGIEVSEADLITQLPFDPTPKSRGIWGNPNQGFVGNINGRMLVDGYGVYWDPIAALGQRYARTEIIQNSSPQILARAIAAGHPVIIWGYYGTGSVHTWKTPAGAPIRAVSGEHTRVVFGFDGPVDSPTRFYLMDPLTGSFSWSTSELIRNWSSFHSTGVIVSPRWVRVPGDNKIWEISADGTKRHWVTRWSVFIARGGGSATIISIAKEKLEKYTMGSDIK